MGITTIEWTATEHPDGRVIPGYTFNPWIGCSKVGQECKFCYAEELMDHRYKKVEWGDKGTRVRTSLANWRKPFQWDKYAASLGIRLKVFCASLADIFEDKPEVAEWREELFDLIISTPNLNWLLLTKRPENISRFLPVGMYYRENLWVGASVGHPNSLPAIEHLKKAPVKTKFLSMEPLLANIDIEPYLLEDCECVLYPNNEFGLPDKAYPIVDADCVNHDCNGKQRAIHWVIAGGESGNKARPMHPDWPRNIRDLCALYGIPYFFKQWGEYQNGSSARSGNCVVLNNGDYAASAKNFSSKYTTQEWNKLNPVAMSKVGKFVSGNELDGKIHKAYPKQYDLIHSAWKANIPNVN